MKKILQSFFKGVVKVPAILGGLVPVFKACPPCPVCMPIYCGILSIVGLELADYGMYLVPLKFVSMALTLGSIGYQTWRYHKLYLLCALAIFSCASILVGKFVFDLLPMVYVGMGGLISALFLHRRAVKRMQKTCCPH